MGYHGMVYVFIILHETLMLQGNYSYIGAWYPRSHANSVRLRYARAYLIGLRYARAYLILLRYARASFIQRYYHCFGRVVSSLISC